MPLTSDKAKWVLELVAAGFALIPYMPGTKFTYDLGWQNTPYDPMLTAEDLPHNYGVILRDDVAVIDVDPRNYKNGIDSFALLMGAIGHKGPMDTFTVKTGGGGLHIYFSKPPEIPLRTTISTYPGIEIKSRGAQLVGPGSTHPDTGKPYMVANGEPMNLLPAPPSLLEIYRRKADEMQEDLEVDDSPENQQRYIDWLSTARPAVWGDSGDLLTFDTAVEGRDRGLSQEVTLELMAWHWNPKCEPPWSDEDLAKKVSNAYRYAKRGLGNKHPKADFDKVELTGDDLVKKNMIDAWSAAGLRWDITRRGNYPVRLKDTISNVLNYFRHDDNPPYYNDLKNLVRLNAFSQKIEFTRQAPWHRGPNPEWTDADTVHAIARINDYCSGQLTEERWCPAKEKFIDGVLKYASDNQYHPVRDYLDSLTWDGTPRIDSLFYYYTSAADTPYTRAVARCFLIACVARIMKPGCQHDHIVILEGKQGTGKSSFCRILGGEFYAGLHLDPRNKDTIVNLLGHWIIELTEFTCAKRSEASELKAFISSNRDTIRKPYGRNAEDVPRQSVFIATINPEEDDPGYLQDQTGNRRFWPIATDKILLAELAKDRDQLFAEAYELFKRGEPWYLTDAAVIDEASAEQNARTMKETWTPKIADWLSRDVENLPDVVTRDYIASEVLNVPTREHNAAMFRRIATAMKELGWEKTRVQYRNAYRTAYRRPFDDVMEEV